MQTFRHVTWLAVGVLITHTVISIFIGVTMQAFPGKIGSGYFRDNFDVFSNLSTYDVDLEQVVLRYGYTPYSPYSAKFPLFAMLARIFVLLFGWSDAAALFVMNKLGVFLMIFPLWYLARDLHSAEIADRAVMYLAFPLLGTGFVWWMGYPEPLFQFLSILTFLLLFRKEYFLAGLACTLCVWSRPQAAALIPIMGLSIIVSTIREHGIRQIRQINWLTLAQNLVKAGAIPTLGFGLWMYHVSNLTNIPLAPSTSFYFWLREVSLPPWYRPLLRISQVLAGEDMPWGRYFEVWHILFIAAAFVIMGYLTAKRKLRWELLAFALITIIVPLFTLLAGIGRYALTTWIAIVPVYIVPRKADAYLWVIGIILAFGAWFVFNIPLDGGGYIP